MSQVELRMEGETSERADFRRKGGRDEGKKHAEK